MTHYYEIESTDHNSSFIHEVDPLYIARCVRSGWFLKDKTVRHQTFETKEEALNWVKKDAYTHFKTNFTKVVFAW